MSHGDAIHDPELPIHHMDSHLIGRSVEGPESDRPMQEAAVDSGEAQYQQGNAAEASEPRRDEDAWRGLPSSARSLDAVAWDENRTETTTIDGEEQHQLHQQPQDSQNQQKVADGSEDWDCCPQLTPIDAEDLVRPDRAGPDRVAATDAGKPRRVAVCHNVAGQYGNLLGSYRKTALSSSPLERQDSGAPPLASVLLVKYYDTHDRLGVYHGHEGSHLGDLRLALDPGSQFVDLCVSNRYQVVYLIDQVNSRVYAVDLAGQLRCTIAKRLSGPLAASADDRHSMLFVCQRKKVRVFQQLSDRRHRYLRSVKSADFRNLTAVSARDGRIWLADSQADQLHVFAVRNEVELDLLCTISLPNPLSVSLDASGSAFVTSGEPLHRVTVYGPEGGEIGSFGGWGSKQNKMKLPGGICAYQLSHIVDKRMVVLCCFSEQAFRMYTFRNLDTSIV